MIVKLYETKNSGGCGKIVGEIDVDGYNLLKPLDLFEKNPREYMLYELEQACISQNQFLRYANGKSCKGWQIMDHIKYEDPVDLPDGIKAPQSYLWHNGYLILAIHKAHSDKIFEGKKTIEIRHTYPNKWKWREK